MMNEQQEIFMKTLTDAATDYLDKFKSLYGSEPSTRDQKIEAIEVIDHQMTVYSDLIANGMLGNEMVTAGMLDSIDNFQEDLHTFSTDDQFAETSVQNLVSAIKHYSDLLTQKEVK